MIKNLYLFFALFIAGITANAQSIDAIYLKVRKDSAWVKGTEFRYNNFRLFLNPGGTVLQILGAANGINFYYENNDVKIQNNFDSRITDGVQLAYYDRYDGFDNVGKLKLIGNTKLTYYDRFDGPDLIGKLKSIGDLKLSYYDRFADRELLGKLKSIGDLQVSYFDRFNGTELMGKVRSIGDIKITYFDRFDPNGPIGRLKSIDNIAISYYSRYDGFDNIGKLKSIGNTQLTYFDRYNGDQSTIGKIKSINGDTPCLQIIDGWSTRYDLD